MSSSIHDKLNRVRKPRVHITYDVETEGAQIERGAALRGRRHGRFFGRSDEPLKPLKDRKFMQIDRDNFNDVMAQHGARPEAARSRTRWQDDGSEMAVDLKFKSMDDFEPARVAEQVPALQQAARDARASCATCMTKVDRSRGARDVAGAGAAERGRAQDAVGRTRHASKDGGVK